LASQPLQYPAAVGRFQRAPRRYRARELRKRGQKETPVILIDDRAYNHNARGVFPWVLAVHLPNGKSHSVEWSEPHFIVGTEVADGIFTVQGDGILSRHLRVDLGEETVTLEPLANAELTEVQGIAITHSTTAEYPVRIRVGSVEMLIDRGSTVSETSTALESIAVGKRQEPVYTVKKEPALLVVNEAASGEKTIESTIAFSMELDPAPVENMLPVQKSYALKKEIARGGMGRIFLAEDVKLERQVAVKVSHTGNSCENSAFYREAKILARLSHPNIVPLHNFGEDSHGRPFYSMKLVEGQTLKEVLKRLRTRDAVTTLDFTLQRLLNIFRRVCHGIEFAHSAGYLHRDLKPENIMIGEHGEVLVMDWGLAQAFRHDAQEGVGRVSQEDGKRVVEGTPQYMSPEQACADPIDERSDIYSLGAILYAILTLRSPVQGKSLEGILKKVRSGEILPIEAPSLKPAAPGLHATTKQRVPTALEAIVTKAMHRDRANRYTQVTALIRDIEAYQAGFPTSAENAGALRHLGLLIRRHSALTAVLLLSFLGASTSAVRLAQSERDARVQAMRAQESALLAEHSAIAAREQGRAAVEAHRASRVAMADAMMASAYVAESELDPKSIRQALNNVEQEFRSQSWEYLNNRLNRADLTIEAPNQTTFKSVLSYRDKKSELIVLLSDGSIQLVNWITGKFTLLGKIDPKGLPPSPSSVPTLAFSRGASSVALIRNFAPEGQPNCQLEIINLSSGETSYKVPLNLSSTFLRRYQIQFNPTDSFLLLSSPNEAGVLLIDVKNQRIKWKYSSGGTTFANFTATAPNEGQSVRVYSSKQIVDLDPETGAVQKAIPFSKPLLTPTRKVIPDLGGAGYFATTSLGWMRFDSQAARVTQLTAAPLGAADIALHVGLNTVITGSPQAAGYGAIQFWDAGSGELLRSEMVFMDKRPSKDWILTSRPDSPRVALTSGSLMKVWVIGAPAYVKSIRSERHREGMGGSNFAFFDQPWHAFRLIGGANGYRMEGIDLRMGEGADAATNSAPVPVPEGVLEASINGRFFSSYDAATHRLTIYESRDGVFNPFQQFENCGNMQSRCPSPDGNSVWRSQHFFTALNKQRFIKLERERYASEDFSKTSTAWVGNTHVVEIVSTVASNETDPAPQKVMVLWSVNQTKPLSEIAAPDAYAVCASPDGTQIAEAGEDMKLRIRNGSTLAIERELRVHDGTVKCVAWNPRLPLIATTSSDHTLKIWDLRTDKQVAYYSLMEGIPDKICWSPDGSALALAFPDQNKHVVRIFLPSVCRQQPE
jgi:serine/threonine protein kinase